MPEANRDRRQWRARSDRRSCYRSTHKHTTVARSTVLAALSAKYSCSGSPDMFLERKHRNGRLVGQRRRALSLSKRARGVTSRAFTRRTYLIGPDRLLNVSSPAEHQGPRRSSARPCVPDRTCPRRYTRHPAPQSTVAAQQCSQPSPKRSPARTITSPMWMPMRKVDVLVGRDTCVRLGQRGFAPPPRTARRQPRFRTPARTLSPAVFRYATPVVPQSACRGSRAVLSGPLSVATSSTAHEAAVAFDIRCEDCDEASADCHRV